MQKIRIYWDTSIKKFYDSLNAALPESNVYLIDFSQNENTYLLYTENEYTPGVYFLLIVDMPFFDLIFAVRLAMDTFLKKHLDKD